MEALPLSATMENLQTDVVHMEKRPLGNARCDDTLRASTTVNVALEQNLGV